MESHIPPRFPTVGPNPGIPSIRPQTYASPATTSSYIVDRFGIRLRTLRKAHGMTQLDLAVNFGIDRSFISDVERGKKGISLPMLEVLALGFRMSVSQLLEDV
jgi:DNA-binding XRE family transcriptional regulator